MKKQLFAAFCVVMTMALSAAEKELPVQFREAYESSNLLVADRIFRQLEATPDKLEPIDAYHAAEVAKSLCNGVAQRDRLMFYAKTEKKWTPELEDAAWWLCEHGGNAMTAGLFARLADNARPDDKLFWSGVRLLDRLREGKRGEEFVGVAAKLFERFGGDKGKRTEVMQRLYNFKRDTRESPGFPHGRADGLWMDYPCPDNEGWKDWAGWFGNNFDWIALFAEKHAKADDLLPPGNMWDRIYNLNEMGDKEAQKKLDARFYALRGEALRLKSGWHYYKIMEQAIRRPANYYPTLEGAALRKAYFDDLMAGAPYYDEGCGQNLSYAYDAYGFSCASIAPYRRVCAAPTPRRRNRFCEESEERETAPWTAMEKGRVVEGERLGARSAAPRWRPRPCRVRR